jgi:N6-adenosine-specific RNA methylase IME4
MSVFDDLPRNHFGAILADPPWAYSVFSEKGKGRSAERHYGTMSLTDICALPVADLAAKNAHLFLWVTGPGLVRGDHVTVMQAWGFKPSALAFVWVKSKVATVRQGGFFMDASLFVKGMGHTTRQNAEVVVLGRRGSPKRLRKDVGQIIVEPRREHSRKPDEVRGRITAYCAGPYLELFARESAPGWQSWGNQATKFDGVAA